MRTVEICRALFYRRLILFFICLISCFIKCKIHDAFKERETTSYSEKLIQCVSGSHQFVSVPLPSMPMPKLPSLPSVQNVIQLQFSSKLKLVF